MHKAKKKIKFYKEQVKRLAAEVDNNGKKQTRNGGVSAMKSNKQMVESKLKRSERPSS